MRPINIFLPVYLVGLFMVGLWPFDFGIRRTENHVRWLQGQEGIRIPPGGMVRTEMPPRNLYQAMTEANALTIETVIRTDHHRQGGPARIVSYSMGTRACNFTLGQEKDSLVFRLRTGKSDVNGLPSVNVPGVFVTDEPLHIAATYDGSSARLYVNGRLLKEQSYMGGDLQNWNDSCFLVLGNEITGNRPWQGEIHCLALYDRTLGNGEIFRHYSMVRRGGRPLNRAEPGLLALYTFEEGKGKYLFDKSRAGGSSPLYIPPEFRVSNTVFPMSPFHDVMGYLDLRDLLVNILGFLPLAVLVYLVYYRRLKSFLLVGIVALALGLAVSLSVEIVQTYSMQRWALTLDTLYNVSGTVLGFLGLFIYHRFMRTES